MNFSYFLAGLAFSLAFIACAPLSTPLSTISPSPAITSSPTSTPSPSTPPPTPTLPQPTENVATQSFFPPAAIEILAPISDQTYSSPIIILIRMDSSVRGPLNISLIDSDGRLLARHIFPLDPIRPQEIIEQSIYFEIPFESEPARLIISAQDEFGRLFALSSVPLLLQASTANHPDADPLAQFDQKIWIQVPKISMQIESGPFTISGIVLPSSPHPLLVQLMTRTGKVLAFGKIYPQEVAGQSYSNFEFTFELLLDQKQWLQVGILESAQALLGSVHFSSLEFELIPQSEANQ